MWVERTPGILEYLESILPFSGSRDHHPHHSKLETLPLVNMMRNTNSFQMGLTRASSCNFETQSMHNLRSNLSMNHNHRTSFSHSFSNHNLRDRSFSQDSWQYTLVNVSTLNQSVNTSSHGVITGSATISNIVQEDESVISLLQQAHDLAKQETTRKAITYILETLNAGVVTRINRMTSADIIKTAVAREGYLWKRGKSIFHLWSKRYYLLSGNCMYYYSHQKDIRPKV